MTSTATCRISAGVAITLASLTLSARPARAQAWDRIESALRDAPAAASKAVGGQRREGRIERVDRSTRTLSIGPHGSLELRNISGDITITAGGGKDVSLEILRRVRAQTDADAALGLQQVQVAVDYRGERATVDVAYPRERMTYQVTTTLTATVPPGTRVTARSVSGNVVLRGVAGDAAVETVSGNVEIRDGKQVSKARSVSGNVVLTDIDSDRVLSAGTISGNVQLLHARASRISVEVVSGGIQADDVTCDSAQLKSLSGSVDYTGKFSPGGRYEFNSHSGSVRVVASGGAGFELQATTFSGRIRPEGLSLQSMTMNRGSLRATIGDGSAVVVAQTFSGDVVIAKR